MLGLCWKWMVQRVEEGQIKLWAAPQCEFSGETNVNNVQSNAPITTITATTTCEKQDPSIMLPVELYRSAGRSKLRDDLGRDEALPE